MRTPQNMTVAHPRCWRELLCVIMLIAIVGCRPANNSVSVLVSGDTHGWITPCGCAANQSGGLSRRATLVQNAAAFGDVLLLDAGGSALGTSPYQRLKFESLLHGMSLMDLAAHNIGGSETEFAPNELAEIGASQNISWLSSNLTDANGSPVGKKYLELQRGGLTIGIAGVIDPALVVHDQWQPSEPVQAVLKSFAESKADVRILLAYLDEGGLRSLAESLPEIDYIIGGPTGQTISPTKIGAVTLMAATNKGKFLAKLRLQKGQSRFTELKSEIVEVSSTHNEAEPQVDNLQDYYTKLAVKDFKASEAGLVPEVGNISSGYAIAGSQSCVECHKPDDAVWHNSKHSHAWDVLTIKGAHFDPHCQQCHTTGYGMPSGFVNVAESKRLVHVGCENCHGPSQAHVSDPQKRTPFQAKEQCVRCHDHENSPEFKFDAYWSRIFHAGKELTN